MKREIVCIVCPLGCLLTTSEKDGVLQVTGNNCDKGIHFAEKETYDPERTLTTTVKLTTGGLLPVRSRGMVKKGEIINLVAKLSSLEITPPVSIGQIIIKGLGENSVDIIATDKVK